MIGAPLLGKSRHMRSQSSMFAGRLLTALFILAPHAHSAEVSIAPTRIVLSPEQRVGTISLRNAGSETVEFQVSVKRWTMDASGTWRLDDLVAGESLAAYPLSFSIEPGKSQTLRAGVPRSASIENERAYRLLVKELPPLRSPTDAPGLRVLSQFSLPVFVNNGRAVPKIEIDGATIVQRIFTLRLSARGDGHLDPADARLQWFDAAGSAIASSPLVLPYVLAGSSASVAVPLSESICREAVRYELEAPSPTGKLGGPLSKDRSCTTR